MKRTDYFLQRRRVAAFTLIELLVVIAIIGILAALIVPISGAVNKKKQISLAQAQMQSIAQAIEGYHTTLGFYPPDNTNNVVTNQLYFELMGTTNNGASAVGGVPTQFGTLDGSAYISSSGSPSDLQRYFSAQGFANTSTRTQSDDQGKAASTFLNHLLPNEYGLVDTSKPQILILACPVPGPLVLSANSALNPWRYNSSHPTNNVGTYDLWVDLLIKGRTNRVCNWSPQAIQL